MVRYWDEVAKYTYVLTRIRKGAAWLTNLKICFSFFELNKQKKTFNRSNIIVFVVENLSHLQWNC